MYKEGNVVVYKKNICKIKQIKETTDRKFYIMTPIDDNSLTIDVPVDSKYIRNAITKLEADSLINKIPNIKELDISSKSLDNEYKELYQSGKLEDLVKIIKTTFLRNKLRKENNKKVSEKDNEWFNKAEKLLYNELSISFDKTYDETKEYIIEKLSEICK